MYSNEIQKEVISEMIDYIESYGIEYMYLCDITDELFNRDYYLIGIYQCKEWLKKYFDDMLEVIEYLEEETGEPYAQYIKYPEKFVSLVVYTVANYILYDIIYSELNIYSHEMCNKDYEILILETLKNTLDIL